MVRVITKIRSKVLNSIDSFLKLNYLTVFNVLNPRVHVSTVNVKKVTGAKVQKENSGNKVISNM